MVLNSDITRVSNNIHCLDAYVSNNHFSTEDFAPAESTAINMQADKSYFQLFKFYMQDALNFKMVESQPG